MFKPGFPFGAFLNRVRPRKPFQSDHERCFSSVPVQIFQCNRFREQALPSEVAPAPVQTSEQRFALRTFFPCFRH